MYMTWGEFSVLVISLFVLALTESLKVLSLIRLALISRLYFWLAFAFERKHHRANEKHTECCENYTIFAGLANRFIQFHEMGRNY